MSRPALKLLACALVVGSLTHATNAHAWKFLSPARRWFNLPIEVYIADEEEESLPQGVMNDLLMDAYAVWDEVPCSDVGAVYAGAIGNDNRGFVRNSATEIKINDLGGDLASGVLAATVSWTGGDGGSYNGVQFLNMTDMDIIFNDGVLYGSPEQIASANCRNQTDFLGVAVHEIGHGLGFGHSCESDEACPDPDLRNATMYWSIGRCDGRSQDVNIDDELMTRAAYGFTIDFSVEDENELVGAAPRVVDFEFSRAPGLDGIPLEFDWNFGDGSDRADSETVTHTYDSEGQYTVSLTVSGNHPDCGDFSELSRKVGYVVACEAPRPSFRASNLGDGVVQLANTTDLGAYGCIQNFEWNLPDGRTVSTNSPTLELEPGDYQVTLTASGHGGEESVTETITVTRAVDPDVITGVPVNCSSSGQRNTSPLLAGLGLLALLGLRRRG